MLASISAQNAPGALQAEIIGDDSDLFTVDSLVRRRARSNPDIHAISYPSSGIDFVNYTVQQLDVFAWRVAKQYEQSLPVRSSSAEKPRVIALLGPSNLEYLITLLALTKLGHTVLPLSTRIPQPAIENLMNVTGAQTLIAEARFLELAGKVSDSMSIELLEIAPRSVFEFPIEVHAETKLDQALDPKIEQDNIAFIIHSSGSTGLPKPIYQTHKACIANYAKSMEMKALITLPLYHNHGICNLFRAIYARVPIYFYNADLPLTQDYLVRILLRQNKFEIFYGVPYALKLLSEADEGIRLLRDLRMVMYGGSACPDELGNALVENGVNLVGHYGATEVGQLMTSFRPNGDKDWNYVREHDALSPILNGSLEGPTCLSDLFEPHPTIPKAWKYIARLDDTIVLVNGEKFGPVGMEGKMRSSKLITEAVVFGAGRPYLGVLIVPSAVLAGKSNEEILDSVWEVVNEANASVDGFGRISKTMIKLLPTDCQYPRTDKGSIIRQAFYKTFKDQIEEAYDEQEASNGDREKLDQPGMRRFVHELITKTLSLKSSIEDDADFFYLGLDSVQSIQMRSHILQNVDLGQGTKLGQNVVFENPSIAKLSDYLYSLSTGQDGDKGASIEAEMQGLIEKYKTLEASPASSVALTGATGSLGAHVLSKLVENPAISNVYCLVRASDPETAKKRVVESLIQRKIFHTLSLEARRKISAFPADLADQKLGLSDESYSLVSQNLRSVIHCAWSVNFNMQLTSFEKGNIAGVHHLLALCHASKASMNFCSSVSTVTRSTVVPVPEQLPNLEWAQGMGYAQSKSVAEHLCAEAANQGVTARVLRVGQIVGDTKHGVWNAQEAVPMLMQTAVTIGALPKLQETPSWLPVDIVAEAVADISLSDAGSVFTNVTHPKTFDFVRDLLPALKDTGLSFEELVDFFASKYDKEEFAPSKAFATEVACSLSPALAQAPVLDPAFVKKFISYFTKNSWSPPSAASNKTAIIFIGPCGTGKTTIGKQIAQWIESPFMRSGTAILDEDRSGWLSRLATHAAEVLLDLGYPTAVVSCSALKQSYRSNLRETLSQKGIKAVFVDLQASEQVLLERLESRKDHYMSKEMVEGQLQTYEAPGVEEVDVLPVDAESSEEEVIGNVKWLLQSSGVLE
uniref:gluconokinase n=1 Tax=Bionectria ochroleuca TaxID=29856 RepID=A0A8H7K449_BIOOC